MAQLGNTYTGKLADIPTYLTRNHLYYAYDSQQLYSFNPDGTPYLLAPIFGDGSSTETDPIFKAHVVYNITQLDIDNWDEAFSWGDHSIVGYLTEVVVTNLNLVPETKNIATVDGKFIKETVTNLDVTQLVDNKFSIIYDNENEESQEFIVDLSSLAGGGSGKYITSLDYEPQGNILTIQMSDETSFTADLSELSITTSEPGVDGSINVFQEVDINEDPILKFTLSKVGQTGEWTDILNKPDLYTKQEIFNFFNGSDFISENYRPIDWTNTWNWFNSFEVVDTNTNTVKHEIATVDGISIKETVTKLGVPSYADGILTIKFFDENGIEQTETVDISSLVGDVTVTSTNDNLDLHEIATIEGVSISETITNLLTPELDINNNLIIKYVNETGDEQSVSVSLNDLNPDGTFDQDNIVRRFKINPANLLSYTDQGVLNYLNTIQGIDIGEKENWVIEIGEGDGNVDPEPTPPEYNISITNPVNGTTLTEDDSFAITSSFTGEFDQVTKIEFLIDGVVVATQTSNYDSPYTTSSITGLTLGGHSITVQVYINNVADKSDSVSITIIEVPVEEIIYYPTLIHRAGAHNSPNTISVSAPSYTGVKYIRRTTSDGTVREIDQPLPWEPPSPYLEGDRTAISIPFDTITEFKCRYNQVQGFSSDFDFNDMPNLKLLWLRANLMTLPVLDISNCSLMETLDFSDNYINDINLPNTSNINFIYAGGLIMNGMPPPVLITKLMVHLVNNGVTNGQMISASCIAEGGVTQHKTLVDRGWDISHISVALTKNMANSTPTDDTIPFMSSTYNWEIVSFPNWLSIYTMSGQKSNEIQNLSFRTSKNNTKSTRQGTIVLRKLKDNGDEYRGRAEITINQPG